MIGVTLQFFKGGFLIFLSLVGEGAVIRERNQQSGESVSYAKMLVKTLINSAS